MGSYLDHCYIDRSQHDQIHFVCIFLVHLCDIMNVEFVALIEEFSWNIDRFDEKIKITYDTDSNKSHNSCQH